MASLVEIDILSLLSRMSLSPFLLLSRIVVVVSLTPFVSLRLAVLAIIFRLAPYVVARARVEDALSSLSTSLESFDLVPAPL